MRVIPPSHFVLRSSIALAVVACGSTPPPVQPAPPAPPVVGGPTADEFFARGFTPVFTGPDVNGPCAQVTHGSELLVIRHCGTDVSDTAELKLNDLEVRVQRLVDARSRVPATAPDREAMGELLDEAQAAVEASHAAVEGWRRADRRAGERGHDTAEVADKLIAQIAGMRDSFRRDAATIDANAPKVQAWLDQLPPPDPALADVRPPVAADLAEYTKGIAGKGKLVATMVTSLGTFHCELLADKAPMTVANFIGLATGKKPWLDPTSGLVMKAKPFYDGLTFHRVIREFMIQGGDPTGRGTGGPGYKFGDETSPDVTMAPGTLAMANAGPSSNGSQFFITEGTPDWLNGKHTIFGRCKEVDLVKKIEAVATTHDRPDTPVTIKSIKFARR